MRKYSFGIAFLIACGAGCGQQDSDPNALGQDGATGSGTAGSSSAAGAGGTGSVAASGSGAGASTTGGQTAGETQPGVGTAETSNGGAGGGGTASSMNSGGASSGDGSSPGANTGATADDSAGSVNPEPGTLDDDSAVGGAGGAPIDDSSATDESGTDDAATDDDVTDDAASTDDSAVDDSVSDDGSTTDDVTDDSAATDDAAVTDDDSTDPPCVVDHGGETPSLREKYESHFTFGAAIDTQYNNYSATLTKHFNSVTAEDQMKFDALQPSEGNFSYGTADQMVNFAADNGMQVRGHALVWHRQTPSWVFSGSREQVLGRMRNHISNVMQHFQGKVYLWDVVNEAIMDDGSYRTNDEAEGQQSGWYGALGEDYIAEAFIAAREADPTAKLFYNDYYNYHPVRRQAIYDMLAGLIADGVPIDGVGLQAHLNLEPGTDPNEQSYHQTVENLEEAIEMYSSLGLDVQITELDLSVYLRGITYTSDMFYTPATFTAEVQEQQAERYREFFDMFRRRSDLISNLTLWGISDDNTWLSEFDSGRQDFPLLFDAQQQPKPAFWAVVDFCE